MVDLVISTIFLQRTDQSAVSCWTTRPCCLSCCTTRLRYLESWHQLVVLPLQVCVKNMQRRCFSRQQLAIVHHLLKPSQDWYTRGSSNERASSNSACIPCVDRDAFSLYILFYGWIFIHPLSLLLYLNRFCRTSVSFSASAESFGYTILVCQATRLHNIRLLELIKEEEEDYFWIVH
jgi:hypothetical protein